MISRHRSRTGRTGTTLVEVLMALLVMGIGLVSVATLFPLSLLRSVEATQLTNATLLRLNAEARIEASQSVSTTTGAVIGHAIVEDPDNNGNVLEHDTTKFVFDPLGMATFLSDSSTLAGSFGWIDANGNRRYDGAAENVGISRFAFGMETLPAPPTFLARARDYVTLPDSFISLSDQLASNFSYVPGGPTVTTSGAAPSLAEYNGQTVRVTALRADVRGSTVRYGVVSPGNVITLSAPFPVGYSNANIGRLLIDIPEQRFSWFATVRRYGVRPSVTVVSCFRRNFSQEDERVYVCQEPAGSYNEFEINLELAGATNNTNLKSDGTVGGLPPGLERGGWMFDLYTFRWWKISSVQQFTRSGVQWARFTTDPNEIDPSPRPRSIVYAIFPQNVVEAYTLKKE